MEAMEILSREMISGLSVEVLYANEMTLINELCKGFKVKLKVLKVALESKLLRVNVRKVKTMTSSEEDSKDRKEGKFPRAIYRKW